MGSLGALGQQLSVLLEFSASHATKEWAALSVVALQLFLFIMAIIFTTAVVHEDDDQSSGS
jgi:hypothetical protein